MNLPVSSAPFLLRRRRHCCYVSIIEGDLSPLGREGCEASLFDLLSEDGVAVTMVAFHDEGCAFTIDGSDLPIIKAVIGQLNVAERVHPGCTRLTLSRTDSGRLPHVARIIAAIAVEGIPIVHLAADTNAVSDPRG